MYRSFLLYYLTQPLRQSTPLTKGRRISETKYHQPEFSRARKRSSYRYYYFFLVELVYSVSAIFLLEEKPKQRESLRLSIAFQYKFYFFICF